MDKCATGTMDGKPTNCRIKTTVSTKGVRVHLKVHSVESGEGAHTYGRYIHTRV